MANREALRELQGRLADRLQEVKTQERVKGWLAVEAGGHAFLLPLAEAGEIFQPTSLLAVPHARPWFLGVANLRGVLAGVVDLAGYLGLRARPPLGEREQARVVAFNPSLDINVALQVDRLAGLRNAGQMTLEAHADAVQPAFVGPRYRDGQGRAWQELELALLARDERFLHIVGVT
ncbi:MAG: chemotaxis protein CheW [Leptothrix sp. (in: b-proteobacteria)]